MIACDKFGQHQPLNRQSERFALEGIHLSVSTLADLIGATCVVLEPVFKFIETTVFAGARLHGDDTTVPVMARGQTDTARTWVYVRDDRPFGGSGPPCAVFYYSRDRAGIHPQTHIAGYSGIFQTDAYSYCVISLCAVWCVGSTGSGARWFAVRRHGSNMTVGCSRHPSLVPGWRF